MNEKQYNLEIGQRIKDARKSQKITLKELGNSVGLSESTTKRYEDGQIKGVDINIVKKFAAALSVSPAWLMGYDDAEKPAPPRKKYVKIPVLGAVVAGEPIEAIEDIEGYEEIPERLARTGDFFGLRVRGASMEPTLQEGDVIICKSVQTCDTGDIAVVMINGDEATVKEIKRGMDGVTLIGHNVSVFPPKFYSNQEIESLPVRIIGIAYEVRRKFKAYHVEEE